MVLLLASGRMAGALGAQSPVDIPGRVVDQAGAPISAAQVTLVDAKVTTTVLTGEDGRFRIPVPRPGRYALSVRHVGYRPAIVRDIEVRAGGTAPVTIALAQAVSGLAPVTVTARALSIDPETAELPVTFDAERIAALPAAREPTDLVRFVPGAQHGQLWGGMTSQANLYQVDGISVNQPGVGGNIITLVPSWLSSLDVTGLGGGADVGDFQGGMINQQLRSGTNRREQRAAVFLESRRLNGSNLQPGDVATEPATRQEMNVEASGPLRLDRLFYFTGLQLVRRSTRSFDYLAGTPVPPSLLSNAWEARMVAKLSAQSGSGTVSHLALGLTQLREEHVGLVGFERTIATQQRSAPLAFMTAGVARQLGEDALVEARLGGYVSDERRAPYAGENVPGVRTFELGSERSFQNAQFAERDRSRSLSGTVRWSGPFTTSVVRHRLRLGVDAGIAGSQEQRHRSGGMTWRPVATRTTPGFDPANASTWFNQNVTRAEWGNDVELSALVGSAALFAQDAARWGRLTVLPGVRLSTWNSSVQPFGATLPIQTAHDVALDPRVGAVVDVTGGNRFVLKAHWGRLHQGMFAQLFERASNVSAFTDDELWIYSGAPFNDPARVISPSERDSLVAHGQLRRFQTIQTTESGPLRGYHQPYVDQLMLGTEALLGGHWKVQAIALERRSHHLVALRDRNLAENYSRYTDVAVRDRLGGIVYDDAGRPLTLPALWIPNDAIREILLQNQADPRTQIPVPGFTSADIDRLGYRQDIVLGSVPEAKRRFGQAQLILSGAFARWSMTASAVWSNAKGNVTGIAGAEDSVRMGAGPFVHPNEAINADGRIERIAPFQSKLLITAALPARLTGGVFWMFSRGEYFAPTFTVSHGLFRYSVRDTILDDRMLIPSNGNRILLEPRGNRHYESRNQVDLHLERAFAGRGGRWVVSLDGLNVFGERTVTAVNTAMDTQSNPDSFSRFGATRARMAPRQLRLGVALQR